MCADTGMFYHGGGLHYLELTVKGHRAGDRYLELTVKGHRAGDRFKHTVKSHRAGDRFKHHKNGNRIAVRGSKRPEIEVKVSEEIKLDFIASALMTFLNWKCLGINDFVEKAIVLDPRHYHS